MTRHYKFKPKSIFEDKKYNSIIISKFINIMMISGKKSIAEKIIYKTLYDIKLIFPKESELYVFENAIDLVKPSVEVITRKIGGTNYQVPIELEDDRSIILAIRWIIISARKRKEKFPMFKRLSNEIMDILDNKGNALKKKEELHRRAEANKAFAHYRW